MDPKSPELLKAVKELRERALPESPEVQAQLINALNPQYWPKLNPSMNVCGNPAHETFENPGVNPSVVDGALQMLSTRGYFQIPPIAATTATENMRACFENTQAAGWHPTFVFVYDEFWRAFRGPALVRFLAGALGEGYFQLPHCWGHYVPANSSGWKPHVDGPCPYNKLTVWLPLNDATLENGCMYVVPRNNETKQMSDDFYAKETYSIAETMKLLQNSKALPAAQGSLLGWSPNLVHWGSTSSPQASPRISISVEFTNRPTKERIEHENLIDPHPTAALPPLRARLGLIARAIKSYERFFDPSLLRYVALAEMIIRETS